MSKIQIAPEQRLTIVKHLAGGKPIDVVATIMKVDRGLIVDVGNLHGYPDLQKLSWAADVLADKLEEAEKATITERPDLEPELSKPAPPTPMRRAAASPAATSSAPVAGAPAVHARDDEIRVLLNTAKASDSKRIQNLANRIFDDVARLRDALTEQQHKAASKAAAKAAKDKTRAEIQRLEAQLREARAKLRGGTASPASTSRRMAPSSGSSGGVAGPSAKEIRTWAADAGVECSASGRIPADVRAAYDAAHATTNAGVTTLPQAS